MATVIQLRPEVRRVRRRAGDTFPITSSGEIMNNNDNIPLYQQPQMLQFNLVEGPEPLDHDHHDHPHLPLVPVSSPPPTQQSASHASGGSHSSSYSGNYYANNSYAVASLRSYTGFLSVALSSWIVYLVLPKGFRRAYCGAGRRRYTKRRFRGKHNTLNQAGNNRSQQPQQNIGGRTTRNVWTGSSSSVASSEGSSSKYLSESSTGSSRNSPTSTKEKNDPFSIQDSVLRAAEKLRADEEQERRRYHQRQQHLLNQELEDNDINNRRSGGDSADSENRLFPDNTTAEYLRRSRSSSRRENGNNINNTHSNDQLLPVEPKARRTNNTNAHTLAIPSPEHPSVRASVPDNLVLTKTMEQLKGPGIRMYAHGVQCAPKRVWIRYDQAMVSITWQTEFAQKIKDDKKGSSTISTGVGPKKNNGGIVLMRGSLHKIAAANILFIDVGKKTSAFLKEENKDVANTVCLSLLTGSGSLDLQASSKLERDALVSCFGMILDQVHSVDWRNLYIESPAPSQVVSATTSSNNNY